MSPNPKPCSERRTFLVRGRRPIYASYTPMFFLDFYSRVIIFFFTKLIIVIVRPILD